MARKKDLIKDQIFTKQEEVDTSKFTTETMQKIDFFAKTLISAIEKNGGYIGFVKTDGIILYSDGQIIAHHPEPAPCLMYPYINDEQVYGLSAGSVFGSPMPYLQSLCPPPAPVEEKQNPFYRVLSGNTMADIKRTIMTTPLVPIRPVALVIWAVDSNNAFEKLYPESVIINAVKDKLLPIGMYINADNLSAQSKPIPAVKEDKQPIKPPATKKRKYTKSTPDTKIEVETDTVTEASAEEPVSE